MLLVMTVCACSTTPQATNQSSQATQQIYDQAKFAFPLSFSEHLPMNGQDFADTIDSYTRALRQINIVPAPVEFQVAYQDYIRAWLTAQALAAKHPSDISHV